MLRHTLGSGSLHLRITLRIIGQLAQIDRGTPGRRIDLTNAGDRRRKIGLQQNAGLLDALAVNPQQRLHAPGDHQTLRRQTKMLNRL